MQSTLAGPHDKIYQHLFQHPSPHNVDWRDVCSMFRDMPDVVVDEKHNGHISVTRNGQVLALHRPHGKDIEDKAEILRIRHFLEQSSKPAPTPAPTGTHLLVVIDHRQARIYNAELHGDSPHRISPYDPFGHGRDLHFSQTGGSGKQQPEQKSFYEAIAKTLASAQQILIFGTATGASSAMEHLLQALKAHHHDIASRIIGSVVVDEHHLTEDQLLAKARELFAKPSTP